MLVFNLASISIGHVRMGIGLHVIRKTRRERIMNR